MEKKLIVKYLPNFVRFVSLLNVDRNKLVDTLNDLGLEQNMLHLLIATIAIDSNDLSILPQTLKYEELIKYGEIIACSDNSKLMTLLLKQDFKDRNPRDYDFLLKNCTVTGECIHLVKNILLERITNCLVDIDSSVQGLKLFSICCQICEKANEVPNVLAHILNKELKRNNFFINVEKLNILFSYLSPEKREELLTLYRSSIIENRITR